MVPLPFDSPVLDKSSRLIYGDVDTSMNNIFWGRGINNKSSRPGLMGDSEVIHDHEAQALSSTQQYDIIMLFQSQFRFQAKQCRYDDAQGKQ